MKFLKFLFSAPLQSWGEDARWDTRSTSERPSKSGVIGFLGCCLGCPRGDEMLNDLNNHLRMAVRTDCSGQILTDFQTVQGTDGVFLNAEGKPRTGGGTIITPKQYLQNARFTVCLQGDEELLEKLYSAMKHPCWTPYLGRKNCVPSVPVYPEWVEADSLEEAVSLFSEEEKRHCDPYITVEMDASPEDALSSGERVYRRNDAVLHAEKNEYAPRSVKSYVISAGGETI